MVLERWLYFLLLIAYSLIIHLGMIIYAINAASQLRRRRVVFRPGSIKILLASAGWAVVWLLLSWEVPSGGGEGNIEAFLFPLINYPALFFTLLAKSVTPAGWSMAEFYLIYALFGAAGGWGLGQGLQRLAAKTSLGRRHS